MTRAERWELCDLARDRTELHDLAPEHPDDVARLAAAWARRVRVYPRPAPR